MPARNASANNPRPKFPQRPLAQQLGKGRIHDHRRPKVGLFPVASRVFRSFIPYRVLPQVLPGLPQLLDHLFENPLEHRPETVFYQEDFQGGTYSSQGTLPAEEVPIRRQRSAAPRNSGGQVSMSGRRTMARGSNVPQKTFTG